MAVSWLALGPAATPRATASDAPVRIVIDPSSGRAPISPLVYGLNGNAALNWPQTSSGGFGAALNKARPTLIRLGGNRFTAYNWENNASNAGADWLFQNDDYLSASSVPGAAVGSTVESAQAAGAATLVTVPIGTRVAADTGPSGDVRNSGPSYLTTRFKENVAGSGPLTTSPDATDSFVHQNQFVYWLRQTHPSAELQFSLDNEPNDWNQTHAELYSANLTYSQLVQRNIEFATAIKSVAPNSKVAGPALDGWQGQEDAVDSNGGSVDHQTYGRFLDYYLRQMRAADVAAGHRLVDTLDLHWYPQVSPELFNTSHTATQVTAREQAPRSLWDPGYVENSWITNDVLSGQAIKLLPRVKQEIADNNPGMGLSISEWNYGGGNDISGGIATADTLGIFGRQGLAAATYWPDFSPDENWAMGAFAAFRNYDGNGAAFGDTEVSVSDSDPVNTSAYGSIDSTEPGRVIAVVINKGLAAAPASIQINGSNTTSADVFTLTSADSSPRAAPGLAATSLGAFSYSMPAQSVSVIVSRVGGPIVTPAPTIDPPTSVPPVSPLPTTRSQQHIRGRVPRSMELHQRAALPDRTNWDGPIHWTSRTKAMCLVRHRGLVARGWSGVCQLHASSAGNAMLLPLSVNRVIRIRRGRTSARIP